MVASVVTPEIEFGTLAASILTVPLRVGQRGIGDQRTSAARPILLRIARDRDGTSGALNGTIAVYGANLPDAVAAQPVGGNAYVTPATANPASQRMTGDGASVAFQTSIPYAAFSNNNWQVEIRGGADKALTGTSSVTAAGVTLTGATGTAFDVELFAGAVVKVGVQIRTIVGVTSATVATVDRAWDTTSAGATVYMVSPIGAKPLSGTVAIAATGVVTGTSTKFLTQTFVNDVLTVNGTQFTVVGIISDTSILVQSRPTTNVVVAAGAFVYTLSVPSFSFYKSSPTSGSLEFSVTSGVASNAIITFGTAPASGVEFDVFYVTPVEVLADAAHVFERLQVLGKTVMWVVGTASGATGTPLSASQVSFEPAYTI